MDDEFKLRGDDTIRGLRRLAQSPGELQFRLELLDKLQRIVDSQAIANRAILQSVTRLRRDFSHLSLTKVTDIAKKEIETDKNKRDSAKWRGTVKGLISHLATAGVSIVGAYIISKWGHS